MAHSQTAECVWRPAGICCGVWTQLSSIPSQGGRAGDRTYISRTLLTRHGIASLGSVNPACGLKLFSTGEHYTAQYQVTHWGTCCSTGLMCRTRVFPSYFLFPSESPTCPESHVVPESLWPGHSPDIRAFLSSPPPCHPHMHVSA